VSSQNTMPQLNQLFKPGAVITARITKEDVSQEAQFDERNQRRCVLCICWCSRLFLVICWSM
jgi:hypothetical protein